MKTLFIRFSFLSAMMLVLNLNTVFAQDAPDPETLPEYIVLHITHRSDWTTGINVSIDNTKSQYKDALWQLEEYIGNKKATRVYNLTDLLNRMSELGYEFQSAFVDSQDIEPDASLEDATAVDIALDDVGGNVSQNLVFKKK